MAGLLGVVCIGPTTAIARLCELNGYSGVEVSQGEALRTLGSCCWIPLLRGKDRHAAGTLAPSVPRSDVVALDSPGSCDDGRLPIAQSLEFLVIRFQSEG